MGGHSWNIYYGSNGGNDVVSFLRTSNTTSGTVDVKAILDWIIANDKTQYGVFTNSWTLDQVQWGLEISGDGSAQGFVNNSFSVTSSWLQQSPVPSMSRIEHPGQSPGRRDRHSQGRCRTATTRLYTQATDQPATAPHIAPYTSPTKAPGQLTW